MMGGVDAEEEYEKFLIGMNPPRVTVDNSTSSEATLVKVDSANKHGSLLEVVQVFTDFNITIKRAYISSDGSWFMDVFHVVDQDGNKLYDEEVIDRIQQSLAARASSFRSLKRSVGVQSASNHTSIELIGRDRPGLLSEIFAVLTDLKCNIVASEVWTHNSRMASVVYITDESTGAPIDNPDRLSTIKRLLRYVLKGNRDRSGKTSITVGMTHTQRRLHQMMYADRDYNRSDDEEEFGGGDRSSSCVTVENCVEKEYTVVYVRCKDRPKLLFDTVCTLTDMQYVVFHGTVISEGPEAYQEYYIRDMEGRAVSSERDKQRLTDCLEAAIRRRATEGLRLELCMEDRVGLLSDVTRIFREHGLSVTQAEVSTRGSQAVNVFYVTNASGSNPVEPRTIEAVRTEIGDTVLRVKDEFGSNSSSQDEGRFSFGNLFRSRSEKFLSNLGLIRSCS
ncbi:uncharacterized protein A4U43_C04F14910 [Asparagus officinalis]|uniref:ACT domain-containing protein ACR n=1 Tax=Asparagus officinalis TaxID=4686 RepID=A0A5P1F5N0_ASPOF|nr:uncharacterized protein A4U43_C04F14910 [Asparagus officinalis]